MKHRVREVIVKLVLDAEYDANIIDTLFEEMPDWLVTTEIVSTGKPRQPSEDEVEQMAW